MDVYITQESFGSLSPPQVQARTAITWSSRRHHADSSHDHHASSSHGHHAPIPPCAQRLNYAVFICFYVFYIFYILFVLTLLVNLLIAMLSNT